MDGYHWVCQYRSRGCVGAGTVRLGYDVMRVTMGVRNVPFVPFPHTNENEKALVVWQKRHWEALELVFVPF
jgi:hypothetical protein